MGSIRHLLSNSSPLLLPGIHDALSARIAVRSGFKALSVGGAALAATQLGFPDLGLQSFGEYRDSLARIIDASTVPVVIDGENGFGDVKVVTRAVRSFESMGVAAMAIEDLTFPPVSGQRPTVVPLDEIKAKLSAALAARQQRDMMIIGRTDAAYAVSLDEAIARAKCFAALGVDAILVTGLVAKDAMKRLRDAVSTPLVAIVIENGPWFAPTIADATAMGFNMILYPATAMFAAATAYRNAFAAIACGEIASPLDSVDFRFVAETLATESWTALDAVPKSENTGERK
jgi:2-methylisocitrate lyase-like PEP mutase family enzyme